MQNASCSAVASKVPALPAAEAAAFMAAYQNFTGVTDESPLYELAATLLAQPDLHEFLSLPDSFDSNDGLDAQMVLCSVIHDATPAGLAQFAEQGASEKTLVDNLLSTPLLMRDMLVAGGASGGQYGQAMQIFTSVVNASSQLAAAKSSSGDELWKTQKIGGGDAAAATFWDDRSQDKTAILRRLALGTAVEHAVPIQHRFVGRVFGLTRFPHTRVRSTLSLSLAACSSTSSLIHDVRGMI